MKTFIMASISFCYRHGIWNETSLIVCNVESNEVTEKNTGCESASWNSASGTWVSHLSVNSTNRFVH
jgi:hypothetical protein